MKLIEVCSGSAAVSFKSCGYRPLFGYLGSKNRYAKNILKHIDDKIESYHLIDSSISSLVWNHLRNNKELIKEIIEIYKDLDQISAWNMINNQPVVNEADLVAKYLILQLWSFGTKQVDYDFDHKKFIHHGYNKTTMYGVPKTKKFGEVKPQLPVLISKLENYNFNNFYGYKNNVLNFDFSTFGNENIFYIDPPYSKTTGYNNNVLSRDSLLNLIESLKDFAKLIIISEREPLTIKDEKRTTHEQINLKKQLQYKSIGKGKGDTEYLTIWRK